MWGPVASILEPFGAHGALLGALGRSRANIQRFFGAFTAIEKQIKKQPSPEPSKITKVCPNVVFIQGLILFSALNYVASVPKMTIVCPFKKKYFQKWTLGGTRIGQEDPKHLVHRVGRSVLEPP